MKSTLLSIIFPLLLLSSCSPEKVSWPEPTGESKPWTRWWWMGNAVDSINIISELRGMAAAGIGGVELSSMYGVKGEEKRYIEYHSPEFTGILKFTIEQAQKLGMGVDIPPGAGWACGGPYVPEEKGLLTLCIHDFEMEADERWKLPSGISTPAALSFIDGSGRVTVLEAGESFISPAAGKVCVAEVIYTGDKVNNASIGGEGVAINTFNEEITNWYLNEFWDRLNLEDGLIRSFFHDSFEYQGDFTMNFMDEFRTRRGYDLAGWLHVLSDDFPDEEIKERVVSDYHETLSDLVLESFIKPMTGWANRHKSLCRNQSMGSPANVLDLYAACDIPETEIFGPVAPGTPATNRNMYRVVESTRPAILTNKFASSAAHLTGKKLVSSESFTWLNENWMVSTSDMIMCTNRLLLAGVNHIFFHGTCYSPDDAEWPGWLFYASTQINDRNPLWRELPAVFKYIGRSQSILQEAIPQNDLLIYWPYPDVAAAEYPLFNYTNIDKGDDAPWFKNYPVSALSEKLMNAGYAFDYISDKLLMDCKISNGRIVSSAGAEYLAVVVPKTKYMPLETAEKLQKIIAEGGKVFFDEGLPESVPGIFQLAEREQKLNEIKDLLSGQNLTGDVFQLLTEAKIEPERSLSEKGFHYIKMKKDDEYWYMIFNCSTVPLDDWVELNHPAKTYIFLDPMNGQISKADKKGRSVRIQLDPEQAFFVKCTDRRIDAPDFIYMEPKSEVVEIKGTWNIEFIEGGPDLPGNIITGNLGSWTASGDSLAERFSGTARYRIEFDFDGEENSGLLSLGDVKDCARVMLNGKSYGTLLGPSFAVKIDNLVMGENTLEVEVTNVAANRIRYYDLNGIYWKKFHPAKGGGMFYSINYVPFDASDWEIRDAGLLGPVSLVPF